MATYEFYAYFDATQVQGVINAIVSLMGSSAPDGNYADLLRLAGVMGLMMAIALGYARARGEDAAHYMIMLALWYSMLFTPRVPLTIIPVGPAVGAPVVVNNVPIGLAFFASTTSKIGHWFTDSAETFFSLPDPTMNFSQHGLMGSTRTLRVANSASIQDPVLVQSLTNFMRDCINPELVATPATLSSLIQSKSIWADLSGLGLINPGRLVSIPTDPVPEDCGTAYTNLGAQVTGATANEFGRIAKLLSPYATPASANTILSSMLPASEGLIMTASASTADAIKQRMMINLLNNTSRTMGQVLNDPAAINNALAVSLAQQSTLSSYQVMAKLAQETLPIIRNTLELVIIGVFPIILVVIILSGARGGQVLMGYVMMMLWVQLWAPLYAIVNYVATLSGANSLTSALNGIDGIAIANAAALSEGTISAEAVAGLLTVAVPVIALALVKGGEVAATSVAGTLMGPSTKAGEAAAAGVASGNVSLGNVSWGNYSANNDTANHSDISASHVAPGNYNVKDSLGSYTLGSNGQVSDIQLPFGGSAGVKSDASVSQATFSGSERFARATTTDAAGWTTQSSSVQTWGGALAFAATKQDTLVGSWGGRLNIAESIKAGHIVHGDNDARQTSALNTSTQFATTATVGGGLQAGGELGKAFQPGGAPLTGAPGDASGAQPGRTPAAAGPGRVRSRLPIPSDLPEQAPSTELDPLKARATGRAQVSADAQTQVRHTNDKSDSSQQGRSGATSETSADETSRVESAVNDLIAQTNNAGEKRALKQFLADYRTAVSAERSHRSEVAQGQGATDGERVSNDASTQAYLSGGKTAFLRVLNQAGGDLQAARRALVNQDSAAVKAMAEGVPPRPAMGTDMRTPNARSEIVAAGSQEVDGTYSAATGKVASDRASGQATLRRDRDAAGVAPPDQPLDQSPATARFMSGAESGGGKLQHNAEAAKVEQAIPKVVDAYMKRHGQPSLGQNLVESVSGRAVYPKSDEIRQIVTTLAANSDSFRGTLLQSSSNEGGNLSPAAHAYIDTMIKAKWESEYEFHPGQHVKDAFSTGVDNVRDLLKH